LLSRGTIEYDGRHDYRDYNHGLVKVISHRYFPFQ
jgi:hypothetical protein